MMSYLIITILLIIVIIQYNQIQKSNKLYKRLSDVFCNGKNIDNQSLVERIIRFREVFTIKPNSKVIELISSYVNECFNSSRVFIHHTNEIEIAKKILSEGFLYAENFNKSTEELSSNEIDITYKMQIRKFYGNYVIVICIPNYLFQSIKKEEINRNKDILEEIGISESYQQNEFKYKLPSKYIKGYIDISNNQTINNSNFQK